MKNLGNKLNLNKFDLNTIDQQLELPNNFSKYGLYIKKNFINLDLIFELKKSIENIMSGKYSTKIRPDRVKYFEKNSNPNSFAHSICNGWKSDNWLKDFVTGNQFGKLAKEICDWDNVKLNQDSLFVVPPYTGTTSFHQDNAYQQWHTSSGGIITAWLAVTEIQKNSGGVAYLLGSHMDDTQLEMLSGNFLDSKSGPLSEAQLQLGRNFEKYQLYTPKLNPGDVIIHHGKIWHGSTINESETNRVSLSVHMMDGESKFSEIDVNPVYNKYKLEGSSEMHSSFFPMIN